ncbi:hypothetical protein Droror1_Dr00024364 [Drosera rotundifolia]
MQFETAAGEALSWLKPKVAIESGEMEEPVSGDVQILLTSKEDPISMRSLGVNPCTYRLEKQFLHFDFHQDAYKEYDYSINKMGMDCLFTDFTGSLHQYQEWTSPLP